MQEWGIYWWLLNIAIQPHAGAGGMPSAPTKHVRTRRWSSGNCEGLKLDKEFIHTITANESLVTAFQWVLAIDGRSHVHC